MLGNTKHWEKLGRILAPVPKIRWMATFTGASFGMLQGKGPEMTVYVTGRDDQNRSHIGRATIDLKNPQAPARVEREPVFSLGELGAFDENGVSYPWIVESDGQLFMYYVGWSPTVMTKFQNHAGLAKAPVGSDRFVRVSRAPVLPRTDAEPFGTGSACVIKENGRWRMWYTVWLRWGKESGEHKHYYVIRHAESADGVHWQRDGRICINYKNDGEYAIGKPSVLAIDGRYHMWYVYRGDQYRIGYAHSTDGLSWERRDDLAGLDVSASGWDGKAVCYPHVFPYDGALYMLYCGNEYGKEGLGLARLALPR